MRLASSRFLQTRISIPGRTALEDVGNKKIAGTIPTHGLQHLIKQLPRQPDKGLTLRVLFCAWSLTDQRPASFKASGTKDGLGPGLGKRTGLTACHGLLQTLPARSQR